MAEGLITQNVLRLKTDIGTCQIELCVGDITKLRKEDKVDVLVISAFPGDYSPTPSSLIGQLKIQLGVNVRELSKNKEEDLRRQYFCWWSKPLPEHLSFKRLLCFEGGFGSRGTKPPKVIGAVFRCLVSILNNKEGSVIMPLLSCGDQGYSKRLVLRQLLNAAVHWMKAGLPLHTLKIVLFSRHPEKKDKSSEPLFELFQEFKEKTEDKDKLERREEDEDVILYDIYISHCPMDHTTALQVEEFLQEKENKDLKIFHDVQELDENESWQDGIYNIMAKCSRIVTLLSPGYLASESCIEQYNIALCISRRKHKEVLAPFYVVSVEYLPTYMGLMQYIDCRPSDAEKLKDASSAIKQWLKANADVKTVSAKMAAITDLQPVPQDYEVFISYSHQNRNEALKLLKSLKTYDPDLNVFIDSSGLNTGESWQQTLYNAIDESKVVVALLSTDYFKSKICKEEFSLALALHMDDSRDFKLVTLLIEDVELPQWCHKPKPAACTSMDMDLTKLISRVAKNIATSLQGLGEEETEIETRLTRLTDEQISIDEFTERYRKIQLVIRKNLLTTGESIPLPGQKPNAQVGHAHCNAPKSTASNELNYVVALSFAEEDAQVANTLKHLLLVQCPKLTISEPRKNDTSRLNALEIAQVIVVFLSPAYINSKELVDELNIALYRHRSVRHQVVYPIQVSPLPPKPTYIRLLPCDFAAVDYTWILKALGGRMSYERIEFLAEENDISDNVASCLLDALDLIVQKMLNVDDDEEHYQVLLNSLEVQKTWEDMRENLSKEESLDSLKRTFNVDAQVMEKEPPSDSGKINEKSINEHPEENRDQGVESNEISPADDERAAPSEQSISDKGKSTSFSAPQIGVKGKNRYDLTNPGTNKGKSCTLV